MSVERNAEDAGRSASEPDAAPPSQQRYESLQRQLEQSERERDIALGELRNLRIDRQTAQRDSYRDRQTIEQLEGQRDLLLHTIERLRHEIDELHATQHDLEQRYAGKLGELDEANHALAEMYTMQVHLVRERDGLREQLAELEGQLMREEEERQESRTVQRPKQLH